jgi:hypothetical protein
MTVNLLMLIFGHDKGVHGGISDGADEVGKWR